MFESTFERRVRAALGAPLPRIAGGDERVKQSIMARVRRAALESPPRRRPAGARSTRYSIVGLALAAGLGSVTTLSSIFPARNIGPVAGPMIIGDTVVGTLRDTLRLVRLMFDAPDARQVVVVGEIVGRTAGRPMELDPKTRRWQATLALRDGTHRYAFVVDGTRWATDPSAAGVRGGDGRLYSLLHVARASN